MQPSLITTTINYVIQDTDYTVLGDASGGSIDITLPPNNTNYRGRIYVVKKIDATSNDIMFLPDGTDKIDGQDFVAINTRNESVTVQADGTGNWRIL